MKRPVLKLATLAIVVYLVTLLAFFPASLAIRWFVPTMPGVTLGPASGTIWNGRLAGVEYSGWNAGNVEWQLKPLALLALRAEADVQLAREGTTPMSFNIDATPSGNISVSGLKGAFALADLERAGLMPRNVASGELLVELPRLVIEDNRPVFAEGRVGLAQLQSQLLPGAALGSYEGELSTTDNVITVSFRDVEAPLRVAGTAQLQPEGNYQVSGSITPVGETPDALKRGLMLLGQADASGRYTFNFNGRL